MWRPMPRIVALLGAHIIKIKLTDHLMQPEAKKVYDKEKIDISDLTARVLHRVSQLQWPPHHRVFGRCGQGRRRGVR